MGYSGAALHSAAYSVTVWYIGPLYVLQLTTVRLPNQQPFTFYPAVIQPREGFLTVCPEDVKILSFLCLRFTVGIRY